jgi:hypothetical protein
MTPTSASFSTHTSKPGRLPVPGVEREVARRLGDGLLDVVDVVDAAQVPCAVDDPVPRDKTGEPPVGDQEPSRLYSVSRFGIQPRATNW